MYTLVSPSSCRCFLSDLALIGKAVSEKIFEYYGDNHIHVSCPGVVWAQPLEILADKLHWKFEA